MNFRSGANLRGLVVAVALFATASITLAGDRRDIVFDCPCSAEWVAGGAGTPGSLTLHAGLRNLRASESGVVWLRVSGGWLRAGVLAARGRSAGPWVIQGIVEPASSAVIEVALREQTGRDAEGRPRVELHEYLALWPVPGEESAPTTHFVDILTDTDSDGVGDVNERLAGTVHDDPSSTPGETEIDVLLLYDDEFLEAEAGYPYTRLLHLMNVTSVPYEDSGTNIRFRTVGMSEVELGEDGWADQKSRRELMDSHGADLSVQFTPTGPCGTGGGCAIVGASRTSRWSDANTWVSTMLSHALTTAHELGHAIGLVHSARQGETGGAWRWSRGHYVTPRGETPRYGTIMARGVLDHEFADPLADCDGVPCGVPVDEIDGADAVTTLDRMRFQVAAHRAPAADSDGDGFVDAADTLPDDPQDWFDVDGDGIGDNADPDDDNDGTDDTDDAFPLNPDEWADTDLDGIGDNADDVVADLSPFRDPALRAAVEEALGKPAGAAITAADMASLTELFAWGRDIRDLTGLELATGLEWLSLHDNGVDELMPLAGLKRLEYLDLSGNNVFDLRPLSELSELYYFSLSDNPVSDLSPLRGLSGIRYLYLNDTQAVHADIVALPYFDSLRGLRVAGLGIRDISALSGHSMDRLSLARNPITDLSPLHGLTALRHLDLSEVGASDVQWLEPLVNLESLRLSGNRIADIGPLADMTGLEELDLGHNRIADIAPLADMTGLEELDLGHNRIADIGPLADMTGLEELDLGHNRIADIGPLADMTGLEELDLGHNRIADIGPLADMTGLEELDLSHNRIADIAPLTDMVEMDRLRLSGNRIADLTPLAGMTTMRRLELSGNGFADIAPLAGVVKLEIARLEVNRIVDVSPLSAMRALRWLNLADNAVEDIEPLVDGDIYRGSGAVGAWGALLREPAERRVRRGAHPDAALKRRERELLEKRQQGVSGPCRRSDAACACGRGGGGNQWSCGRRPVGVAHRSAIDPGASRSRRKEPYRTGNGKGVARDLCRVERNRRSVAAGGASDPG